MTEIDEFFMRQCLLLAEQAAALDEVPVGSVIVLNGEIIGQGYNQPISSNDPSAHAEIAALRDAAVRLGNYRLPGATLYVTVEPCTMCAGALIPARIARLVFGALEPRSGSVCSHKQVLDGDHLNHRVIYEGGCLEQECGDLIQDFFRRKREATKAAKVSG